MQTAAQLTANHLYTEVVIDDYPFLNIGIDKPYNTPTSASSIVADLDHDAIAQIPIAHKQDLLRKITTAHFVYSSEAKKLLRTLSDRERAGLDASDILARMASLPISTRCAVMRNMDMVVDESLSCFTPNVVNVTFSSWDHRPLQPCPILVNFNVTGTILLEQSMAHQFVHPPPIRGSTSVESLFGGQYTKLSATYRCRSRCEGLPSIRLQQSFSTNPTEINVAIIGTSCTLPTSSSTLRMTLSSTCSNTKPPETPSRRTSCVFYLSLPPICGVKPPTIRAREVPRPTILPRLLFTFDNTI
jgi:hypothetical protein